jgi:hypothetical protein
MMVEVDSNGVTLSMVINGVNMWVTS